MPGRGTKFRAAVDIDRFIARNQPTWDRLDELTGRAAAGLQRLHPRRARRAGRALPAGVGPPVPRPHRLRRPRPHGPPHPPGRPSQRRHLRPAGRGRCRRSATSSRDASRPRCGRAGASWPSAPRCCCVPALAVGVWLATDRRGARRRRPRGGARGVPRGGLRGLLLVRAGRAVRHRGHRQQHPGGVPRLRRAASSCACPPRRCSCFNGANVGVAGGLFAAAGRAPKFFGLILPHGLLELTAVVIAGAAGLRLGWAIDRPRRPAARPRRSAEEGRRAGGDRPRPGRWRSSSPGSSRASSPARGCPPAVRVGIGVARRGGVRRLDRRAGPRRRAAGPHRCHRRARPRLGRARRRPRALLGVAV